ncbi:DUF6053 domain-containing protein [Lysobacter enzymogenes]
MRKRPADAGLFRFVGGPSGPMLPARVAANQNKSMKQEHRA